MIRTWAMSVLLMAGCAGGRPAASSTAQAPAPASLGETVVITTVRSTETRARQMSDTAKESTAWASQPTPPPRPASALVFEPDLGVPLDALALDRSIRQPSALVGYDENVATYFFTRTDDRQLYYDRHGNLDRTAISVRTGIRYR